MLDFAGLSKRTMDFKSFKEALLRQARKDTLIQIFLVFFVIVQVPYFLPGAKSENLDSYTLIVTCVFFLPFIVAMLWPREKKDLSRNECVFWKVLSFAFGLWWVVSLLFWLLPIDYWVTSFDIITDFIFICFYICWMISVSFSPHDPRDQPANQSDRWYLGVAVVVLTLCLFCYFILIPSRMTPEIYDTWVPSLIFYTGLDAILAGLFLRMAIVVRTPRWKILYGLLALTNVVFGLLDLLEAWNYSVRYQWAGSAATDTLWNLPYVLIVVIVWIRHVEFPQPVNDETSTSNTRANKLAYVSPVILTAFILPIMHILLEQLGLLGESTRRAQTALVLGGLTIFCVLAIMENRALRRVSRKSSAQAVELQELRIKQTVAKKAEYAKAQFLANVSHEIRTPMNGILGMSEILLRGELSKEQKEHATLVKKSAQGMLEVVDDILEYSKFEAGELSLTEVPFRLDELSTQVLDLFRTTEKLQHVETSLDFKDDVPLDLIGDPSRLRQVLVNLVANAVKFTQQGEIRISFSLIGTSESMATILCEVTDSGIGIKPEEADVLFLPFSQGDESTSRKYGGSGLGLAISKQIVEAQSGKIGVITNPKGGSVFWFEIPFKVSEIGVAEPVPEPESIVTHEPAKRILLAEDDLVNQLVAVKQLEVLGQNVDVAANGIEVLEALKLNDYACILMDCQMPELDGLQATRLIRRQGYSKTELPIVALTANVFNEDRERCFEAGMNDFIAKPVLLESLRKVLVKWL